MDSEEGGREWVSSARCLHAAWNTGHPRKNRIAGVASG
jgi:hypothetical protein